MADWYQLREDRLTFTVQVQPGAKRTEVIGLTAMP